MIKRLSLGVLVFTCVTATASVAGPPAGSRPLTAEEIRKAFVGHTWSGSATGLRPSVLSSAERKVFDQSKKKPTGQWREYFAPNGEIKGWVGRTDFDARTDGTWHISGNQLCAFYRTQRFWKPQPIKGNASFRWCYRFVYHGKTLLMSISSAPAGADRGGGAYFRPRLSKGDAATAKYNSVGR